MPTVNRSGTFWEEVADQIGIFLSVVLGFVTAQAVSGAVQTTVERNKVDKEDEYFPWAYAVVIFVFAIFLMACWSYFVSSRIYHPAKMREQIKSKK